jgi:hypothetical protein
MLYYFFSPMGMLICSGGKYVISKQEEMSFGGSKSCMYVWFLVIILHVQIAPKSGLMDFVYHGT